MISPVRGDFEAELAQVCERYKVGVIPYSPLAGGLLTGKYRKGQALPDSVRAEENAANRFSEQNWNIIEAVVGVAERTGMTPAQVAINWLRAKPSVTAPILGANRPDQLTEILSGLDVALSAEDLAALDQVSDFQRSRTALEQ